MRICPAGRVITRCVFSMVLRNLMVFVSNTVGLERLTCCTLGVWLWFRHIISKCVVVITLMSISSAIAFKWIAHYPTDEKPTLVQVMDLQTGKKPLRVPMHQQAKSHYVNQYWLRFMTSYDVILPQWIRVSFQRPIALHAGHDLCHMSLIVAINYNNWLSDIYFEKALIHNSLQDQSANIWKVLKTYLK